MYQQAIIKPNCWLQVRMFLVLDMTVLDGDQVKAVLNTDCFEYNNHVPKWVHDPKNFQVLFWFSQERRRSVTTYNGSYYIVDSCKIIDIDRKSMVLSMSQFNVEQDLADYINNKTCELLINVDRK